MDIVHEEMSQGTRVNGKTQTQLAFFTQDTDAEGPETFFVNLTSVELVSGQPVSGAEPSIKNGQNVAEITIRQNDNANGILELDATKV